MYFIAGSNPYPLSPPPSSAHHSALPVKRLWQFLVKQDYVQDTFIRNIFTKKRGPNEVRRVGAAH